MPRMLAKKGQHPLRMLTGSEQASGEGSSIVGSRSRCGEMVHGPCLPTLEEELTCREMASCRAR